MTEETFEKKLSEIFDKYDIPEDFHDWFVNIAREESISYVYEEVLDCLPQFAHGFSECIEKHDKETLYWQNL